jgi:uncharacterized membrane protein
MRVTRALIACLALLLAAPHGGAGQEAVVRAVLFYSPTCPHCHEVINNDLPPLRERFGDGFVVVGVDVTTPGGQSLYQATVDYFALPDTRLGVPSMVVGLNVMVGSQEIPEQLPGIIERGLASGGIDWPPVDAVREVLDAQGLLRPAPAPPGPEAVPPPSPGQAETRSPDAEVTRSPEPPAPAPAESPVPTPPEPENPGVAVPTPAGPDSVTGLDTALMPRSAPESPAAGWRGRFAQDPAGNGVAVGVLVLLAAVLTVGVKHGPRGPRDRPFLPAGWIPALAVAGMGIAAYLAFVEVTGADAVCGPIGDCNTVQQSEYARILGILPVGVLGLAGYAGLLTAWLVAERGPAPLRPGAWTWLWGMAVVGTLFSAYLTFLEPFVIGATCAWCVSSALIMAALLAAGTRRRTSA